MTRLVALSRKTHAQKVWQRVPNYQFAAEVAVTPIVLAEVANVGAWMPIAFLERTGRYVPMAMMSPVPKHNLFVGPDGQWLGGYVPSPLRSYPFRLFRFKGSEKMTLCIDEDSGVIRDADEKGEYFFTTDGKLSQSVSTVMEYMRQIESNRMATDLAVASLAEVGVIEPWALEVRAIGRKAAIKGLYRVNEAALGGLDNEAFLKLRKTSALRLAYAQVMSIGQIARFDQLLRLQQQLAKAPEVKAENLFQMPSDHTIQFD